MTWHGRLRHAGLTKLMFEGIASVLTTKEARHEEGFTSARAGM